MVDLLHQLGFTYKKPKIIPGKADADKQMEYLEENLRPAFDNAGYNKAPEVTEYAAANKINLMFLPPYSPKLYKLFPKIK